MKKKNEEASDRKLTHTLKGDLDERSRQWAARLNMDAHEFVNRGMEGFMQALESDDIHFEIPFLRVCRMILKKPSISSKVVSKLLSMFAPKLESLSQDLTAWHNENLIDLLELSEAPLNPKLVETFQKQAEEMTRLRFVTEKEIEKAKSQGSQE